MQTLICTRCNTTAPRTAFKRLASRAQTRSWLKNPDTNKRMWYFGSTCNACHKQTKRKPSELTPEEHRKRLVNENNGAIYAWQTYNERRAAGKKKLSANAVKMLKERRAPLFVPVMATINKLIATIKNRQHYITKTNKGEEDVQALKYLGACLAQATLSRDKIWNAKKAGCAPPERWQNLMGADYNEEREHLFAQLPGKYKDRFAKIHKQFL